WRQSAAFALAALGFATARCTFMQVGFHQQSAGRYKMAGTILRQQSANVFTSPDGNSLRGGRKRGFLAYALPHALAGGVHGLMVRLLSAHGGKRMVKQFAWIGGAGFFLFLVFLFLVLHRGFLVNPLKSFFS